MTASPSNGNTPQPRDDRAGYPEKQPRDKDDARHRGHRRTQDPDDGGLDRDPEDGADPVDD